MSSTLYSFDPPYDSLNEITPDWTPPAMPAGNAIVWRLDAGQVERDLDYLERRPRGLALLVVLPPPLELIPVAAMIPRLNTLSPHAVLPAGNLSSTPLLKAGFSIMPRDLRESKNECRSSCCAHGSGELLSRTFRELKVEKLPSIGAN